MVATLEFDDKKVATATEVRDAIGDVQRDGKRAVLIRLKSDDVTKFLAIWSDLPLGALGQSRTARFIRCPRLVRLAVTRTLGASPDSLVR
jgi:hypothetical protein